MIKQLLNSVLAKYCNLSVAHRITDQSVLHVLYLLATDKSQYFAQPHPI